MKPASEQPFCSVVRTTMNFGTLCGTALALVLSYSLRKEDTEYDGEYSSDEETKSSDNLTRRASSTPISIAKPAAKRQRKDADAAPVALLQLKEARLAQTR
jgi:hypothetical protein